MAAFAQPAFVSVEEYLRTAYSPDCELVNGYVEERNLGEYEHSRVQHMLDRIFGNHEAEWQIKTAPECRLQVSATNFRVPDVMVLRAGQKVERIVKQPPLICMEVLSPEDGMSRMQQKVRDYLQFGVEHIWFFDPEMRLAYRCDENGFHKVQEEALTVPGTAIRVVLADVFAVLDS
ncbi:MAG TPA: Uma2 family endonuclease [Acidobacteriaceae bacterium]